METRREGEFNVAETETKEQTILVAADGSPAAQAAGTVAIQIASSEAGTIRGLYVLDEMLALNTYADHHRELGSTGQITSRAELLGSLEAQGSVALEWLASACEAADVPSSTQILAGGVAELVQREAKEAHLVALGRRGHGHADNPEHLGRNFRAIARRVERPLLAGGDVVRPVHRLLLAYNGTKRSREAMNWVARLRDALPAEVAIVAVQETEADRIEEWLEEAQTRLAGAHSTACWCLQYQGIPAVEIVAAAEEIEADLVVMGRYGHSALIERLAGSTVDRVLRNTALPVLMV
jgi:nucleotide-binding universal stress UspA family protein